ncbi:hypothetical protein DSOUD_0581 [Desulfuromonas soudanensis]|uniref:Transporter n=1 Tax=Desulfuromonas soudanensis TaxID=1603606 RepID=A0A0M4DFR1_9BACT|nr:hypothetical protein [Desulfuromonas soudanensis]ALC15370.1 hypothetical protein DSOUD_0581 [Desulfuromonas soudanensis]
MKRIFSVLMLMLIGGAPAFAAPAQTRPSTPSQLSALTPLRLERASVLDAGTLALNAGLAVEFDREVAGFEYDNIRLAPLGVRFGVARDLEVGASLAFSVNDANEPFAPDESGLEGLTLFGKVALNDYAALQVGLTALGADDVAPYPNDGLDLFVNLPLQRRIGAGLLYGELGYTVQGGDFDTSNYINYGLGFGLPLTDGLAVNIELAGEEAHVGTGSNTLDLTLGVNLVLADQLRLAPYIALGLYDASPDVATGVAVEMRF